MKSLYLAARHFALKLYSAIYSLSTPLAAQIHYSQLTHSAVLHSLLIAKFTCFRNKKEIQSASFPSFCIIWHNHVVKLSQFLATILLQNLFYENADSLVLLM